MESLRYLLKVLHKRQQFCVLLRHFNIIIIINYKINKKSYKKLQDNKLLHILMVSKYETNFYLIIHTH